MLIALEVVGLLSMMTFMFVAIWGFIVLKQIYSQFKYKNYLLEKLNQNISAIRNDEITISSKAETDNLNENDTTAENITENDATIDSSK